MKNLKKIYPLIFFLTLLQVYYCKANAEIFQNNNQSPPLTVENLTLQSYISPKMQWSVLSLPEKPAFFEINRTTGAVQGIATVKQMLQVIEQQLSSQLFFDVATITSFKQALHVMLEATNIAFFIVDIKTTNKDAAFRSLANSLIRDLDHQRIAIQKMLDKVSLIKNRDKLAHISWMWKSRDPLKKLIHQDENILFDDDLTTIKIPATYMEAIIQNNNYLELSDVTHAANLLCKQCFIAQQPYNSISTVSLKLHNHLSAVDYIFTNIPDIYDKYSYVYPMCDYIKSLDDNIKLQLLHLQQAIQTAISIVRRQIIVNARHFLPVYTVVDLNSLLHELMKYDAHLNALYGEQKMDVAQVDTKWSMTSKVVLAMVVTAVIGRVVYLYSSDALHIASEKYTEFLNWFNDSSVSQKMIQNKKRDESIKSKISEEGMQPEEGRQSPEPLQVQATPEMTDDAMDVPANQIAEKGIDVPETQSAEEMQDTTEQKYEQNLEPRIMSEEKATQQFLANRTWTQFGIDLKNNAIKELQSYYAWVRPKSNEELPTNWGAELEREDRDELLRQEAVRESKERIQMQQADRESREIEDEMPALELIPEAKMQIEREQAIADIDSWAQQIAQSPQQVQVHQNKVLPPVRFLDLYETSTNQDEAAILSGAIAEPQAEQEQLVNHSSYWFQRINEEQEGYFGKIPAVSSSKTIDRQAVTKQETKALSSASSSVNTTSQQLEFQSRQEDARIPDDFVKNEWQVAILPDQQLRDIPIVASDIRSLNKESVQEGRAMRQGMQSELQQREPQNNSLNQETIRRRSTGSGIDNSKESRLEGQVRDRRSYSLDSSKEACMKRIEARIVPLGFKTFKEFMKEQEIQKTKIYAAEIRDVQEIKSGEQSAAILFLENTSEAR